MTNPEKHVSTEVAPSQERRIGFGRRILKHVSNLLPEDSYFFGPDTIYPVHWRAQDAGFSDEEIEAIRSSGNPRDALSLAVFVRIRTGQKFTFTEL